MTDLLNPAEKNKAVYQRFIQEVFNEGRLDRLDAFLSPAYVYRDAPPGTPPGADGIKQIMSMFRAAFPDLIFSNTRIDREFDNNEVKGETR
jgi:predicted SnoaL-like aldol condensation-catalyzing enzyme